MGLFRIDGKQDIVKKFFEEKKAKVSSPERFFPPPGPPLRRRSFRQEAAQAKARAENEAREAKMV